jgi:hypothetical protein
MLPVLSVSKAQQAVAVNKAMHACAPYRAAGGVLMVAPTPVALLVLHWPVSALMMSYFSSSLPSCRQYSLRQLADDWHAVLHLIDTTRRRCMEQVVYSGGLLACKRCTHAW